MSFELTDAIANSDYMLGHALPHIQAGRLNDLGHILGCATLYRRRGIAQLLVQGVVAPLQVGQMQSVSVYLHGLPHVPESDKVTSLRDDVDAYIDALSVSEGQKTALLDFASDLQSVQEIDMSDADSVQNTSSSMTQSVVCLSASFDNPADAHTQLTALESYTANTEARAQQYTDYNAARGGFVTRLPSPSNCQ